MAHASMNPIAPAFLFLFGLVLIFLGVRKYLDMQKIANTPTSKVSAVALGLVELFGQAKRKEETISPISKTKCTYWSVLAQYYKSGKHGGWKNLHVAASSDLFYLQDDTGKMLVDPHYAEVNFPNQQKFEGYMSGKGVFGMPHDPLEPAALNFINSMPENVKSKFNWHKNENLRLTECTIREGEQIYVLGSAETLEGAKSPVHSENLIVKFGARDKKLIISNSNEKKLLNSMYLKIILPIVFGILASAAGVFLILYMLNPA